MVLSCKSPFLVGLLGLDPSQHMALLTQQLHHCLADHTLLQFKGSMLALALITLELETRCPDWLALTIDLLRKAQVHVHTVPAPPPISLFMFLFNQVVMENTLLTLVFFQIGF